MSSAPALPRPCRPGPPARRGRPILPPGPAQAHRHGHRPRRGRPPPSSRRTRRPASPRASPRTSPQHPAPAPNQATSFDRLARTVRRTIALARKLSEPAREAPGPKLRLHECPKQRRADCAETDASDAEPWAEPCERAEGPDCDADEDLDDDFDDQSFADLIASLRHDSGLATLTDAELRQHRTPPSAQAARPMRRCAAGLCAARRPGQRPRRPGPRAPAPARRNPDPAPTVSGRTKQHSGQLAETAQTRRRRMGIEPTARCWRASGFEDQGGHQTPIASTFDL